MKTPGVLSCCSASEDLLNYFNCQNNIIQILEIVLECFFSLKNRKIVEFCGK